MKHRTCWVGRFPSRCTPLNSAGAYRSLPHRHCASKVQNTLSKLRKSFLSIEKRTKLKLAYIPSFKALTSQSKGYFLPPSQPDNKFSSLHELKGRLKALKTTFGCWLPEQLVKKKICQQALLSCLLCLNNWFIYQSPFFFSVFILILQPLIATARYRLVLVSPLHIVIGLWSA